jgi:hypothetical protein
VHSARALGFRDTPGREYWWNLLDDTIKKRIKEKVGQAIEWWAHCHPVEQDRPYAVVFGPYGLAVTTPTVNNAGRPAHLLQVRHFEPSSIRHVLVRQQPSRPGPSATGLAAHRNTVRSVPAPQLALTEDMRGFLGNLPSEAQAQLQEPFLSNDPIQDSGYFYSGSDEQLNVWCYLAGSRTVTFVSGRGVAPAGIPLHAGSWQAICRLAKCQSPENL